MLTMILILVGYLIIGMLAFSYFMRNYWIPQRLFPSNKLTLSIIINESDNKYLEMILVTITIMIWPMLLPMMILMVYINRDR